MTSNNQVWLVLQVQGLTFWILESLPVEWTLCCRCVSKPMDGNTEHPIVSRWLQKLTIIEHKREVGVEFSTDRTEVITNKSLWIV